MNTNLAARVAVAEAFLELWPRKRVKDMVTASPTARGLSQTARPDRA